MAICEYERFVKKKICIGDLRHKISIELREQQASSFEQQESTETFTKLVSCYAAIKTLIGSSRFDQVNIDEEKATHLFYIKYSFQQNNLLGNLEEGNHFVRFKSKLYRILKTENKNEDDLIIILQAIERGSETKLANYA